MEAGAGGMTEARDGAVMAEEMGGGGGAVLSGGLTSQREGMVGFGAGCGRVASAGS